MAAATGGYPFNPETGEEWKPDALNLDALDELLEALRERPEIIVTWASGCGRPDRPQGKVWTHGDVADIIAALRERDAEIEKLLRTVRMFFICDNLRGVRASVTEELGADYIFPPSLTAERADD